MIPIKNDDRSQRNWKLGKLLNLKIFKVGLNLVLLHLLLHLFFFHCKLRIGSLTLLLWKFIFVAYKKYDNDDTGR